MNSMKKADLLSSLFWLHLKIKTDLNLADLLSTPHSQYKLHLLAIPFTGERMCLRNNRYKREKLMGYWWVRFSSTIAEVFSTFLIGITEVENYNR